MRKVRDRSPFSGERDDPFGSFMDMDLDEMFEAMNEMFKRNLEMVQKKGDMPNPLVYGFSYSQRPGEEPEFREFGNVYTEKDQLQLGERRPLVEVFDSGDKIQVVAEMPGIEKNDVELNIDELDLEIKAERGERKYNEVVTLPCDVVTDSAKATYKNGVLEITFDKKKESKNKKKIKVE
jgi:HSP20 family protein